MQGIVKGKNGDEIVKEVTVDFNDVFDMFIYNTPKILEDYPILNMEYKTYGEHVMRQNIKDLKSGLNEVNALDFTFEEKDDMKRTYRNMIQKTQIEREQSKVKKLTRNREKKG